MISKSSFDAVSLLEEASEKHRIDLCLLVAETSLWAHPEVARRLTAETGHPCYFPNTRRCRENQGERRGQVLGGGVRLDDNTYANHALKQALGLGRSGARGFEVCHIWPASCYDELCHTAIPNLVLLPRSLAGLSDHNSRIREVLQFRSFELYRWVPRGIAAPQRPNKYPACWREPLTFSSVVEKALKNRRAAVVRAKS